MDESEHDVPAYMGLRPFLPQAVPQTFFRLRRTGANSRMSIAKKPYSTSPIERLNKDVKRRAEVVGSPGNRGAIHDVFTRSLRNKASIIHLIGAVPFEQNGEWQTASRYMQVEAFAQIDHEETDPILGTTTQAA